MGALLAYFQSHHVVDFQNVEAMLARHEDPEYSNVYYQTQQLLEKGEEAYNSIVLYQGCNDLIRQAISNPKDSEKQLDAFTGLFANVSTIKSVYYFSQELNDFLQEILELLLSTSKKEMTVDVDKVKPLLLKAVADLLQFVSKFDWAKMQCPAIQNDFSFYRRSLERQSKFVSQVPVEDTEAGHISMFVAQATPFTSNLSNYLSAKMGDFPEIVSFLAEFANICNSSVFSKVNVDLSETIFAAMTVSIILYDNLETTHGVFNKSPIEIKKCIQHLKQWDNQQRKTQFLNSIKYSTRTYKSAPQTLQKLMSS